MSNRKPVNVHSAEVPPAHYGQALVNQAERITALDGDMRSLTNNLAALTANAEKQWAVIAKIGEQVNDISATVRASPRIDIGRLVVGAVAVGSLVAMLVGGITYIVAGSQRPELDQMRSDIRLLDYKLSLLQERGRLAPSSDRGPRANLSYSF